MNFLPHFKNEIRTAFALALFDIKLRYRRSIIGPIWLTLSTFIFVAAIGAVYSRVMNIPLTEYLPYMASGYVLWTFFSASIIEGAACFTDATSIIKEMPVNLLLFIYRTILRNLLIVCHNLPILALVFIVFGVSLTENTLLLVPGLIASLACLSIMVTFLSILCCRYRDIAYFLPSVFQVLMLVTPLFWKPEALSGRSALLKDVNIFYHMVEVMRQPLLGNAPSIEHYVYILIFSVILGSFALPIYMRHKKQVALWL